MVNGGPTITGVVGSGCLDYLRSWLRLSGIATTAVLAATLQRLADIADLLSDTVPTETNPLIALKSVLAQLTDLQTRIANLTADVATVNVTSERVRAGVSWLEQELTAALARGNGGDGEGCIEISFPSLS